MGTCSILIKGLARCMNPKVQEVSDSLALLLEVDRACDPTLRSTLYHAVLDAASRTQGAGSGSRLQAQVFAQMRSCKVSPNQAAQRRMVHSLPDAAQDRRFKEACSKREGSPRVDL